MRFQVVPRHHALRSDVEDLVTAVFLAEYGAVVRQFPELMIAVVDGHGQAQCAAALRDQESGFFSEQYLDQPIESVIALAAAQPVTRSGIVELSSLAARRPTGLLALLRGFAEFGLATGRQWGVFTATARMRHLAARIGVPVIDLGKATPDRLQNPQDWGTYYAHDPRICAVTGSGAKIRLVRGASAVTPGPLCKASA